MSHQNVEIVRAAYEAAEAIHWNIESAGPDDRARAIGLIHSDVVIDATRNVFNPKSYMGIEGLRQWQAETEQVWSEVRTEGLEFIDAGDRVVVAGRLIGKGTGSGVEVQQPLAQVAFVHNGRVSRLEIGYTSRAEALEALGLSE
jgi:ketosteroid isomerase-like protein